MQGSIPFLVKKSRSVRRFREECVIDPGTLLDLLDIARFCPSARNRQPLRYIISTRPEETARIHPLVEWALDLPEWDGPKTGERPPAYITIVTERNCIPDPRFDAGIAAQTILLAATELGLAGCMIGSTRKSELQKALLLPRTYDIQLVLAIGYPKETVVLEDLGPDGDTRYWRDASDIHHVPKRSLQEIVVRST